jgi:hypothetical protein
LGGGIVGYLVKELSELLIVFEGFESVVGVVFRN